MKRPCGPLDIISDLPNNIIENILMRLPICDAVGTSILSKKWRYKWLTLPHLVIDNALGKKLLGRQQSAKNELVSAVYQVLLLHKGPIVKFVLEVDELESCSDIDHWINFLSNHDIQEFTLSRAKTEHYKLPSYFFTFLHLRHLKLRGCAFRPPPRFKGFSKLISLQLEDILMDAETFGSLISSCPLLEQLTVSGYIPYDSLEISAPNLKSFSFTGDFGSICFKNTLLLAEVTVALCRVNKNVKHQSSNLIKIGRSLPAVEKLYLEGYFLEFLALGNVPKRLPILFNNLKVLHLDEMDFSNLDEILCSLCLITSSPNLEELRVVAYAGDIARDAVVEYFGTQNLSHYSLKRLQKVKMEEISNFEPELEFIKFILASSPSLEQMEVLRSEDTVDEEERKMWKELMRFRRASPKAEVIYLQ